MPLLDTRNDAINLVGKFIIGIVLQTLSFIAETERENIRHCQAEGIKLAKERGVYMERPKYIPHDNFDEVAASYLRREIKCSDAVKILNMARGTFLKYVHLK